MGKLLQNTLQADMSVFFNHKCKTSSQLTCKRQGFEVQNDWLISEVVMQITDSKNKSKCLLSQHLTGCWTFICTVEHSTPNNNLYPHHSLIITDAEHRQAFPSNGYPRRERNSVPWALKHRLVSYILMEVIAMGICAGFSWGGVNFLHSAHRRYVLDLGWAQVDNTDTCLLLLSRACTEPRPFLLFILPL